MDMVFGRAWVISTHQTNNLIAVGYDDGAVLFQFGKEEPVFSVDSNMKIYMVNKNTVQCFNPKKISDPCWHDSERLSIPFKDVGTFDFIPSDILHSPNGRFVTIINEDSFVVYSSVGFRSKCFGKGMMGGQFAWSADSTMFGIAKSSVTIVLYRNFEKQPEIMKPRFGVDAIFGGPLLGVKSTNGLAFYDWQTRALIRLIDISIKSV
ncbi:coatomer subunit beta'-like [Octopus sinensis]|uniref:Coatomer subunit beta'-like n=1 Tax=Octopus sinensis TaxID=2607531 RepID=A0A6P7U4Z9_9MOLL|nr:coatomer subunit beta'-like [Octopus sinensis]